MSANLVKYLHLHKNFNWHHLLNSKENSFSCLSRAIAASSRTSSFPKATPRAQEPPTHSRSIPQSHASCARTANTLTKHSPSIASCARTANTLTKHSPSIASCARTINTLTKHSPSTASCARTVNTLTKHSPSIASCARTANTLTKQTCSSASVRFAKPK